jgi:hypothetical protein
MAKKVVAKVVPTHKSPIRSVKKLPSDGRKRFPRLRSVTKSAGD